MPKATADRSVGQPTSGPVAVVQARRRCVVIDMAVASNSPAGSCVRAEVEGLARQFDVTVFTARCDLPALPGVEVVTVPAPERPVLLRYLTFHWSMPWHLLRWRLRGGRADLLQATQGQLPGADIAYAHFCHAAYLKGQWLETTVTGPRRWARWATHAFNARCEARAFRKARMIVVPSLGLQRELDRQYPESSAKVRVLANPVDIARFRRPDRAAGSAVRHSLGLDDQALVIGFMALGDFARKGLGLLIEALSDIDAAHRAAVKLLVIGGQAGEIGEYQAQARHHGVADHLIFAGMQSDVRGHLWACDLYAFPSAYEIFSLAILQAAAAGLPVLVSRGLYGAEEFVVDGRNGWVVERDRASLAAWYARLLSQREALPRMGEAAAASAGAYDAETFRSRWTALVGELLDTAS